jgi:hypothetical protein
LDIRVAKARQQQLKRARIASGVQMFDGFAAHLGAV